MPFLNIPWLQAYFLQPAQMSYIWRLLISLLMPVGFVCNDESSIKSFMPGYFELQFYTVMAIL